MDPPITNRQNVVLIGFMGSGKSTVGERVAAILGFAFCDTDVLIERAAGVTIPTLFQNEGEEGFRKKESATLQSLGESTSHVISTGGGIVTVPDNIPLLRRLGFVVWLRASDDEVYARISKSKDRPLLQTADPQGTIRDLLGEREPLYSEAANLEIDTNDLSPEDTAYGICESARHYFSTLA